MKGSQVMGGALAEGTELLQSKDKEPGVQPLCTGCNLTLVYRHPANTGFCRLLM